MERVSGVSASVYVCAYVRVCVFALAVHARASITLLRCLLTDSKL